METLWGWERFFTELEAFLRDINRQIGVANRAYSEYALERLEISIQSVSSVVDLLHSRPMDEVTGLSVRLVELLQCLRRIYAKWQSYVDEGVGYSTDERVRHSTSSYTAPVSHLSDNGRPRYAIKKEQLEYLRCMSFSWTQISRLLGVSCMTVYRRRQEFGMTTYGTGTQITDEELHEVLQQLRQQLPSLGQTLAWGRLRSMGFEVTRERIRRAMRTIDPLHNALRWRGELVQRQPYSVPGPNSLWHLDGHHKLIRWKLVTHGAIDGFSRLVVFLQCSGNNSASTVYDLFLKAIRQYGLPSRVRCDEGLENVQVARHMLRHRGEERNSVLVGSSVHNQRIECLWRDMHRCVTSMYYRLFYYLESNDLLNPIDRVHLFALNFVYVPRINQSLQQFVEAWNSHGVRTEKGQTPHQLFTSGSLQLQNSGLTAMDFFDVVPETYGVFNNDLGIPSSNDEDGLQFPPIEINLSEDQITRLQSTVDPLVHSNEFGVDLYVQTLDVLQSFLSTSDSDH